MANAEMGWENTEGGETMDTHIRLGYGTFVEYAERLFGYGPRLTQDELRVAEALEELHCDAQRIGNVHVGTDRDSTKVGRGVVPRATQDIPPAVRRAVLHRDGRRCVFPGCRSARFLDLHHIKLRAEGGHHHPDNLITICGAHRRALHGGEVRVEGRVSSGLRFLHADGTAYGGAVSPGLPMCMAKYSVRS